MQHIVSRCLNEIETMVSRCLNGFEPGRISSFYQSEVEQYEPDGDK